MHAAEEPYDEEECKDIEKDVEEGLPDVVGIEDEECEAGGGDGVEEMIDVVAGEVEVDGFGVVESVADEADDAIAGVVDDAGGKENEDVVEDVEPDVGDVRKEGVVGNEGGRDEHEGSNDGLVGSMGEVGIAKHAVHSTVVDGGVQDVEDG